MFASAFMSVSRDSGVSSSFSGNLGAVKRGFLVAGGWWGGAHGFGIKGVADHIKAGDISSAPYPAGYEPAGKLRCVCST